MWTQRTPQNVKVMKMTILGQSAPDIQRKLQKVEGPSECLCHTVETRPGKIEDKDEATV